MGANALRKAQIAPIVKLTRFEQTWSHIWRDASLWLPNFFLRSSLNFITEWTGFLCSMMRPNNWANDWSIDYLDLKQIYYFAPYLKYGSKNFLLHYFWVFLTRYLPIAFTPHRQVCSRYWTCVVAIFWASVLCHLTVEEACFRMRIILGVVLISSQACT